MIHGNNREFRLRASDDSTAALWVKDIQNIIDETGIRESTQKE